MYTVFLVAGLAGCQQERQHIREPLTTTWEFRQLNTGEWLPARVPGGVHSDLLAQGLIPDPFIGTNEDSVQWVEEKQWEYRTRFTLEKDQLDYQNVALVFEGLDTYAEVFLNGQPLFKANNMFRTWRANVKEQLRPGTNELRIVFSPPVMVNKEKLANLPYRLPAGSETGKWPVSPFTRKAAYQFGWDFAPRLVTMGIWQPVYLDCWQGARIDNVHFIAEHISTDSAVYQVRLKLLSDSDYQDFQVTVDGKAFPANLSRGWNEVNLPFCIEKPQFWWPNGWGEPHMYEVEVGLQRNGVALDAVNTRLGVRTIALVQEKDSIGESFYFKVNGQPLFAKGANWSPLSSYPGAVADSVYENRLQAVKEANMNMLRVWGGGIYEKDIFYDLCDEYGILIWQDFMFANSMYPGDSGFIRNVEQEVTDQITRLRNHPSLALWNGNNEIEVAWKNWGWQQQFGYSPADSARIWHDYTKIFHQLIPDLLNDLDPGSPYTPTSPLSNWGKPENFNYGSMHYWGVWHGQDTFEDYRTHVGRFMAEYGFQAYPDVKTVGFYTGSNNFKLDAPVSHQKSYVGNGLITEMIAKYWGKPDDPAVFIEKSQQVQALAYKTAIEAHRLNRNKCGGTLFWQLNDCWPGPSWSVIDYFGYKKEAYEVVKDRFKPVILIIDKQGTDFSIYVASDMLSEKSGALTLELFTRKGDKVWVSTKPILVPANTSQQVYRSDTRKLLDGMPENEVFLKTVLRVENETVDVENFYFVLPLNYSGQVDLVGR